MLTSLSLKNFKCWKEINNMQLAPITGLFGSNSSGKTGILQLLLMLKQTVDSPDLKQVLNLGNDKSFVNLGAFKDIIYNHNTSNSLKWSLDWKTLPQEVPDLMLERDAETDQEDFKRIAEGDIRVDSEIRKDDKDSLYLEKITYSCSNQSFFIKRKEKNKAYELGSIAKDFKFERTKGKLKDLPSPIKFYGFPDEVRAHYKKADFLFDLASAFEKLFKRIYYLGPLREYPRREYTWVGTEPSDVGNKGDRFLDAILASRNYGKKISRGKGKKRMALEEIVSWWLKELGLIHDFSVEQIAEGSNLYQIWVKKSPFSSRVLLTDVGFGVSQILPVLVLCYYVPENSIILLEQPEIHLHPAVQMGLADVFIDAVKTRKIQIIVESH